MEKIDEIIFYTLEKSIKVYRKYAQNQILKNGYDITIDQWLVLKTLQENKNLSQNQIAELVFKDFASITRIIELLSQKKYIQRTINNNDRRKFVLDITEEGNKIIEKIYPIVIENRAKALTDFNLEEINNLKTQLDKIINNCKN
ncbi:DNA-binding MarR family transcriptional regulator [Runella defluvii]|uniref:HTH-type transcriptional regulator SarZ n=1 Tax=Runella defluvii TaxID=370973 RepID=A0A7W6EQD2_9BACT|nr:MarR family transcriptional regulator [Runella defluvii]MBB3838292.1 DNA-binding MarR family transcriptional regulator [Runella defluvii]